MPERAHTVAESHGAAEQPFSLQLSFEDSFPIVARGRYPSKHVQPSELRPARGRARTDPVRPRCANPDQGQVPRLE